MSCEVPADRLVHTTVPSAATVNPCTLCAPLGAALATAGIRNAVSLLHGAQGCATYIRRYLISHFREPIDIASSSFGESQTVMGGEDNLGRALDNIVKQYGPDLVTVATTCLAETIGEDVPLLLRRYGERTNSSLPMYYASTPSFRDGHVEGYHSMILATVKTLATQTGEKQRNVNVLPSIVSPADIRHLRELVLAFGLAPTILPDYSETLDGIILDHYRPLPHGGISIAEIAAMPRAFGTLDLTMTGRAPRASDVLASRGVPATVLGLPIGVRATDAVIAYLKELSGNATPAWLDAERGRLLDAYADGHKYVFRKRVGVYGDPELVAALAGFLLEIGASPVVCATGARNRALHAAVPSLGAHQVEELLDDSDFLQIEKACRSTSVELLMGSSKGYRMARALGVPLIRVGFPIHDRIGAGRMLHLGYRGTFCVFDSVVNTLLAQKQEASPVGFSYL